MSRRYDVWARFARNLRAARERSGLSQSQVAAALGMPTYTYASFERGRRRPSVRRLRRLCEVLQASADALLFDGAKGVVSSPPVVDPPELRRLRRLMRRASPRALRFVERILDAIDERTQGESRAPDEHAAADAGDAGEP